MDTLSGKIRDNPGLTPKKNPCFPRGSSIFSPPVPHVFMATETRPGGRLMATTRTFLYPPFELRGAAANAKHAE
jgi:hypothetical protein